MILNRTRKYTACNFLFGFIYDVILFYSTKFIIVLVTIILVNLIFITYIYFILAFFK